jgi:hypothetical protein
LLLLLFLLAEEVEEALGVFFAETEALLLFAAEAFLFFLGEREAVAACVAPIDGAEVCDELWRRG